MFKLPDLPYAYNALEPYIDQETMHIHHDGHHATYVKNLNEILAGHEDFLGMGVEELLQHLDQVPEDIRIKVKNNAGGHYHHSIFWTILAPEGGEPSGRLLEALNQSFGSFDGFKTQFNNSASSVFGSGWTWLVNDAGSLKIVNSPNQNSPISLLQVPILGTDLWEHAYYLKYKNKRAEWIENFWKVVNWKEIENRLGASDFT